MNQRNTGIAALILSITVIFISRGLGMASCFTGRQTYVAVPLKPFENHVALGTEEPVRLPECSCALGRGGHSRKGQPFISDNMNTSALQGGETY